MMTVQSPIEKGKTARGAKGKEAFAQRRCLVSGLAMDTSEMVRFVRAPEGGIVPDIAARLPGHGLWVAARREAIDEAARRNLFKSSKRSKVRAPENLAALTADLLRRSCLNLLGLARTAGALVLREGPVLEAQSAGTLACVLLAADAGGDIRKKLSRASLLEAPFGREELGAALGREICVALGLKPHPLTDKIKIELARLRGLTDPSLNDERNESSDLK